MPRNVGWKVLNALHRTLVRLTRGRVAGSGYHMPVLELTTTGRKSGRPRPVMLTSPLQEGTTIVVVASRGGAVHHPDWFYNVQANPDVEVSYRGGPKQRMRAHVASAEERARLWPRVTADHANYAGYQERTEREIPLVLLEPAP